MKKLIVCILCCLVLTACGPSAPAPTEPPTQPVVTQPRETQPEPTQTEPLPTETEPVPTETEPIPTEPELFTFTVYWGNENADGLLSAEVQVPEINEAVVIAELVKAGAIPEGVAVNELTREGSQLNIDFNEDFLNYLYTMGTSGELMLTGSVVNTFLSAYGAESVMFTVNGGIVESGHVVYDFPLTFTE